MNRFAWPLAIFMLLVVLLAIGLSLDPREVPSPFIGKPAPEFSLQQLHVEDKQFSPEQLKGKVWLFNIWASWCVSCRQEHPLLMRLSKTNSVPIYGLNYKDKRGDAINWLKKWGDPYQFSAHDLDGAVGIDWGVYGVPETFVIDKAGVVRHKHIGPVTSEALTNEILPLVKKLQAEG